MHFLKCYLEGLHVFRRHSGFGHGPTVKSSNKKTTPLFTFFGCEKTWCRWHRRVELSHDDRRILCACSASSLGVIGRPYKRKIKYVEDHSTGSGSREVDAGCCGGSCLESPWFRAMHRRCGARLRLTGNDAACNLGPFVKGRAQSDQCRFVQALTIENPASCLWQSVTTIWASLERSRL